MSGSLGDNKFFKFANKVANVLNVVAGVLLFLAVFHLIDMRSTAVSVVLCAIMVMMAVACAIVADIQVKRKKSIGDGEDSDESNPSVDT